jgi:DNA-binding CsgD family transcriptional regulator
MRRTILLYGLLGGILIAALKLIEYRYLVLEHSLEIYGGIVAAIFASLGIWLGLKMTGRPIQKEIVILREATPHPQPHIEPQPRAESRPFAPKQARLAQLGIGPREHEILTHIAAGLSTREIAEKLSVSQNTVKTHSSRLFDKLNARRRTQAVQIAKEHGIIA